MTHEISPVPKEARPYQGGPAGLVTRLLAATVDALTVAMALLLMYAGVNLARFLASPRTFELGGASFLASMTTALAVCVVYLAAAWSMTGRTYGDHVMGLRVIGRGHRVGVPRALVRSLLCVGFPVGLLWCAVNPSRRSVQDVLLHTAVIYDWRPRHPGDETTEPLLQSG